MDKKEKRINMDLIAGILLAIIGAVGYYMATTYPKLSRKDLIVGANLFPKIAAVGMIVCGIIVVLKALIVPKYRPAFTKEELKDYGRVGICIAMCILFAIVMKKLGFIVSGILLVFGMQFVLGNRKWLSLILVSILVPIALFVVFKYGLQVNMPVGVLDFLNL